MSGGLAFEGLNNVSQYPNDTLIIINANINSRLIENIFFKNSPLHDGAMIIDRERICAAGCILPVSHDEDVPRQLGLRHRSALGISQFSDALAINILLKITGVMELYR